MAGRVDLADPRIALENDAKRYQPAAAAVKSNWIWSAVKNLALLGTGAVLGLGGFVAYAMCSTGMANQGFRTGLSLGSCKAPTEECVTEKDRPAE